MTHFCGRYNNTLFVASLNTILVLSSVHKNSLSWLNCLWCFISSHVEGIFEVQVLLTDQIIARYCSSGNINSRKCSCWWNIVVVVKPGTVAILINSDWCVYKCTWLYICWVCLFKIYSTYTSGGGCMALAYVCTCCWCPWFNCSSHTGNQFLLIHVLYSQEQLVQL